MPNVYDMDEMAVWSDMVSSSAADKLDQSVTYESPWQIKEEGKSWGHS